MYILQHKDKAFQVFLKRFVVFILLINFTSCTNKIDEIKEVVEKEMTKEEFGSNVEILITKKGNRNNVAVAVIARRIFSSKLRSVILTAIHSESPIYASARFKRL